MDYTYLKFSDPCTRSKIIREVWWKRFFKTLLSSFIPTGNPNFEHDFENVKVWLIEIRNDNKYPYREIGLDILQRPIMIMPWRKNYGYWTDNNLQLKDFKTIFNAAVISKEEFDKYWNEFEEEHEND